MNEIYVVGHRNPDTDSIVAAMSYAALRNALGDRNYVAAYLGHVSDETQRLLDRFGFQPPHLIQNVRTQVSDLDYDTPPALNATVTMDRAWHIMREQRISAIPVVNEDGTLYGTLSAGDIATYSMNTISEPRVESLPLFNLLSVIEGRVLNDTGDLVDSVTGKLTTNSLFAEVRDGGTTAVVTYARHLQNLDEGSGLPTAITRALQEQDIQFVNTGMDDGWDSCYPGRRFTPIYNENLAYYDSTVAVGTQSYHPVVYELSLIHI